MLGGSSLCNSALCYWLFKHLGQFEEFAHLSAWNWLRWIWELWIWLSLVFCGFVVLSLVPSLSLGGFSMWGSGGE